MKWSVSIAFAIAVLCWELSLPSALTFLFSLVLATCAILAITCPRKKDDAVFNQHVI